DRPIGDKQVEPTVVVVIKPFCSKAGEAVGGFRQPGLRRDVVKFQIAVVTKQTGALPGKVGDKDVVAAAALGIFGGYAHSRPGQALHAVSHSVFESNHLK